MNILWMAFLKKKAAEAIYQKGFTDGKKIMLLHMNRLKNEIALERRNFQIEIDRLNARYAEEIFRVRAQEQEIYNNILDEKNFEIGQLNRREREKTKVYETVKHIACELEKRAGSMNEKYNRVFDKAAEIFKLVESANEEISHFTRLISERDPKVTKLLEGK